MWVSKLAFAFTVGPFQCGGSGNGNSPVNAFNVHSHSSLLAVDMADREMVGWRRLVEGLGGWDALFHLFWVINIQVSGRAPHIVLESLVS